MPTLNTVSVVAETNAFESGSAGVFRLERTGDLSESLTVALDFTGSAALGTDYTSAVSVTFGANSDLAFIYLTPIADNLVEADDETATLTLGAGSAEYGGIGEAATITLVDDAPFISLNALNYAVAGGASGTFRFARSGGDLAQALPFTYSVGGSATPGLEYQAVSGSATFAANSATADVAIVPNAATPGQADQTVMLQLTGDGTTYLSIEGWSDFVLEHAELTIYAVAPAAPEEIVIVAAADAYAVVHDRVLTVDTDGVLANDLNYDENALVAVIDAPPEHGTVELEPDGTFVYTPDAGYVGEDTFWYHAESGEYASDSVPVAISVTNHRPVAVSAAIDFSGTQGRSGWVEAWDADGDPLAFTLVSEPYDGTVDFDADGSFDYTPDDPAPWFDNFSFTASDGVSLSDEGTLHLWQLIPVPENGHNWGGAFTGLHSRPLPLGVMVALPGEFGTWPPTSTWSPVVVSPPEHGTLASDLSSFTPDLGYIGTDTFTFYMTNGIINTNTAQVYLTLVNNAPVTRADAYTTPVNVPIAGDVTDNDDDVDQDVMTAHLVTGPDPQAGDFTLHGDGTFDFAPADGYHGIASFTYRLTDGAEWSLPSTTYITVQANPTPRVMITDRDGHPVGAGGLKVAKWLTKGKEAFEMAADGKSVVLKGPDANNHDFIDRDEDRFNVWVYDKTAWNELVNGVPANKHVQVDISTTNIAGFKKYNDNATPIDLVRYTGGGAKANPEGWFWSDSQMLVSNKIDDEFPASTSSSTMDMSASDYLALDDSDPGPDQPYPKNGGYIWKTSDRTHLVALDGTVMAEYTSPDGTKAKSVQAEVPDYKTLKIHVTILRTKKETIGGVPIIEKAEAAELVFMANEQLAQVRLRVAIVDREPQIIDPPVDLSDGLTRGSSVNSESSLLLAADNPNPRTLATNDVELYFVNFITPNRPAGIAFPASLQSDQKYADSVIISKEDRKPFTIAHEVAHLLINSYWHYDTILWPANLMRDGTSINDKVEESKRLNSDEEVAIYNNRTSLLSPALG